MSPDYESWVAAETFGELAEVVDRPMSAIPAEVDLVRRERLAACSPRARDSTDALRDAFDRYQRDLDLLGLSDAQVCASYRSGHLRFVLAWALAKVVAAAPFAALGAVVHAVPYQIMKKLGTLPTNEGVKATVKLLGCFASFTLLYIALGCRVRYAVRPRCGGGGVRGGAGVRVRDGVVLRARQARGGALGRGARRAEQERGHRDRARNRGAWWNWLRSGGT